MPREVYTTPAGGVPVNGGDRKGLFGYGNLSIETTGKRRAFQYGGPNLFAPDNWSCNVVYVQNGYPELFAGDKLISLSVASEGGVALNSVGASTAYFSGTKATPSAINNCIPDITAGQFYVGGYDPAKVAGYVSVPAWTVHSLRIYDRVLSEAEIVHNASLDKIRYLAPPTVKFGNTSSPEVIVLSSNFLMCKVPPGSEGNTSVTIDGKLYPDAYKYVKGTDFHISGISPIIGATTGVTVTLTGNKVDEITKIIVDNDSYTGTNLVKSNDGKTCSVTLLPHPAGEVDIIILTNGNQMYRLAKVFEYQ
jgi:hypothetical protein